MSAKTPFVLTLLALAVGQAWAQQAPAQPASAAAADNAMTVVVTARKVDERVIDVPLSIKALGGRDLDDRGITSLSELSLFTPGLSYSPDFGRTQERPVVRGISALRPEAPQPVSVFIDGVFVKDGALGLAMEDAQRVEVIKGPQSALYGRSTYAGAINYITVKPGDKFQGKATATIAGQGERSVFAAVTLPIQPETLSVRGRVRHYEYGGTYTNALTGNKIGTERTTSFGANAFLRVTPDIDASFAIDESQDRDGLFAATIRTIPTQAGGVVTSQNNSTNVPNGAVCNGRTINIVGNNAQGLPDANVPPTAANRLNGWPCGASNFSGTTVRRNEADLANYTDPATGTNYGNIAGLDRRISRAAFTLNWNFGGGYTFTSQSAHTDQVANLGADQSYNGTRFAPGFGAPAASWLSYDRDRLSYTSQEFRLSSPQETALTWLAGLFWYDEKADGRSTGVIAQNAQLQTIADPMRPKSGTKTTNVAPFGRLQYAFSPALRASLEGRYNRETVKVGGTALGTAVVTAGTCTAGQPCSINGNKTFSDFSPRFTLDFKPMKDMLLYAQAAKGSKSGGFNTTAGLPSAVFAYDGEKVTSYEGGAKTLLAGGALALNAAIFRNDIDGLQLSNISTVTNPLTGAATTTTIVNNVGKARTQGLELDGSWRAAPWLTLAATYAYTDAKAREGTEITNGTAFGGNRSVAGFTLPRTPKHSATGSIAVDAPRMGGVQPFGRVDVIYQSRRYAEIQNLIWSDPYTRVNLSAGVRGSNWRASLWVKNATNDDTSLNGFRYLDPVTFRRTAVDFLPRERQFGVTGSVDF